MYLNLYLDENLKKKSFGLQNMNYNLRKKIMLCWIQLALRLGDSRVLAF